MRDIVIGRVQRIDRRKFAKDTTIVLGDLHEDRFLHVFEDRDVVLVLEEDLRKLERKAADCE